MGSYRWLPLIVAGTLLIGACSGSNPASPGATNPSMPGATGAGSSAARPEVGGEKVTVKGAVADARTGEGVAKAIVVVQAIATDVLPTATGSFDASGSMAAMPGDATASVPTPPPAPAASAGRQGATAPRRPAPAPEDPKRPRKVTVDGQGQFEIKDMAPGTYQITAYAPGYQAITIVGNRPAQLNLALVPHKAGAGHEVSGKVLSAAAKPAAGAHIVAGVLPGLTIGDSTTSNDDGRFALKDLKTGKTPIAAYLADTGEIKAWALQPDVPVAVGKDKKTPTPELTLRAVTNPVIFSGKVTAPTKELKPRQVAVQLVTDYGEVPLLTRTPDKEGYFRFSLPPLVEGQTYHLIASGASEQGDVVYAHRHKLNASDLKLEVELPTAAKAPNVAAGEDPVAITWDGMEGASVYRLRLETTADEPTTVWEGYSTGTRITLPDHDVIPLLRKSEKYRLTLSAIKVADGTAYELSGVMAEPWAFAANHAPVEFVYGEGAVAKPTASRSIEPLPVATEAPAKPKPVIKPQTKPQVKPQAKPAPKATPKPKAGKVVSHPEEPRA